MALKAMVALSLAAVSLGAEVPMPSISDAEIDGALGSDDSCAATGDEGAMCALQALQLKAGKHDADARESEEVMDSCDHGMLKQVKDFAPGCINACRSSCGALGSALNAYLTKGGQPAAWRDVCRNKWHYNCFFDHMSQCKKLIDKAGSFGFSLPSSSGQLSSKCR